jgi:hypothetical protein
VTEAEIVLMSLTNEELDDAVRWLGIVHAQWLERIRLIEERDDTGTWGLGNSTDGPMHLIRAIDLAIVRERAQRGGAEPWYAGMSLDDHPARTWIRHYQERIALNPDEGRKPRLTVAGLVDKVCTACQVPKPLTVAFWGFLGSTLDDVCRPCRAGSGPTAVRVVDVVGVEV